MAGKTVLASRIIDECSIREQSNTAYFYCVHDDKAMSTPLAVMKGILLQTLRCFPNLFSYVDEVRRQNPGPTVTSELVVQQILEVLVHSNISQYFIIDGLDEISDRGAQVKILQVVNNTFHVHNIPLIFLIASRPEQEISHTFRMEPLSMVTGRLLLDETFRPNDDIQVFRLQG